MALTTLNLSGIKFGDSLNISVSQGGLTAGPYSVGAWGGGGDGGTLAITVDRTTLKLAPDSVRFGLDLSGTTFDTPGPTGSEVYDARLHDILYFWEFGDPGSFTVLQNVLEPWKDANVARGPWVAHIYSNPKPASLGAGNGYTASVLAYEPSSGKIARASVEVFVEDPDVFYSSANTDPLYSGAKTICVNEVGDSDFSDAPAGATQINVSELLATSTEWTDEQTQYGIGGPRRWLFKCGIDIDFFISSVAGSVNGPFLFGSYGTGNKPILRVPATQDDGWQIDFGNPYMSYDPHWGEDYKADFRVQGIDFRSAFDPTAEEAGTTGPGIAGTSLRFNQRMDVVIDDCEFRGFAKTTIEARFPDDIPSHLNTKNSIIRDFGGQYTYYSSTAQHPDCTVSAAGLAIIQDPGTPGYAFATGGARGPVRLNDPGKSHLRSMEVFHCDPDQPCIKNVETASRDGCLVNIHSCSLEGGLWPLSFCGNTKGAGLLRLSAHNLIADSIIIVGAARTGGFIRTRATGLTCRNFLMIQPGNTFVSDDLEGVMIIDDGSNQTFDETIVGAAPIRVYSSTILMDRTYDQNKFRDKDFKGVDFFVEMGGATALTAVSQENNVFDYANQNAPYTGDRPLATTVLWEPRYAGYINPTTLELQVNTIPPAGSVRTARPETGSTVIGAATTGDVAFDSLGDPEGPRADPPSKGAYEPS